MGLSSYYKLSIYFCFLGQGDLEELMEKLRELAQKNGWPQQFIANCLAAPKTEPKFPNRP